MPMAKQLSKSDYLMYLRHPAWLWLKKNDPGKLPPVDDNQQAIFDQGNLFESVVEQRYAGLIRLGFDNYQEYLSLPKRTAEALQRGERLIAQARFEAGQITCICDVIEQGQDGQLDLVEIKASTSVKTDHIDDLAFQVVVLQDAGYSVGKISVIHCNNQYVRHGEIEPDKLTVEVDVSERVLNKLDKTRQQIDQALAVMAQPDMPDPSPARARGYFKDWLQIYLSLKPPSDDYHIYQICRPNPQLLAELEHGGISKLADIPDSIALNPQQARQVEVTRLGQPVVHQTKIDKFLDGFSYPLYFLDYETLASVLPPFDGLRPYQQLPFQYSLHVVDGPEASPRHLEYLHTSPDAPGPGLLAQLQRDIGPSGSVVVWYADFERGCNSLMAELWPQYAVFLQGVNDRVVDLMEPFARGWYIHCDFYGSASIKKVLPVLVPELSYKALDIQEGASAQRLWMQAVLGGAKADQQQLFANLRRYCELDTLAMVKIYQALRGKPKPSQLSIFDQA